ncbi:MAG TPA: DEAD/DEAH box helicase, partial [Firmicutes bacterium]|nr:DEAD/DEAH box helicase [Bacillota bacterium]
GDVPVMLAHPASVGHGLNLQDGGSTIIWFGLPWSLELYLQANARIHRQGQKNTVVVHHLVAEGTIDEDVMQVLRKKEAGQEALLEAVKARIKDIYQEGR